jgi:hypothetical protein
MVPGGQLPTAGFVGTRNKSSQQFRDFIRRGIKRKMPCIEDVNLCVGHVLPVKFRLAQIEDGSYLPQDLHRT